MDPSVIVVIVVVAFFAVLIGLAAYNTAKRKKQGPIPPPKPRPKPQVKKPEVKPVIPPKPKKKEVAVPPAPEKEEVPPVKKKEVAKPKPKKEPEKPPKKEIVKFEIPKPKPLTEGLTKTRKEGLLAKLKSAFGAGEEEDELLEAIEDSLITADVGAKTAMELVDYLRDNLSKDELMDPKKVLETLKNKLIEILTAHEGEFLTPFPEERPAVIMVVGVNGTGKTTTIGKLGALYKSKGYKVLFGAGDTFRAAGSTQLKKWAEKIDVPIVEGPDKADPASVLFDAIKKAQAEKLDLVIADTAGRLHTNTNLVDELKKVYKVIGKAQPGAPHEVLLVLDATMGQNSIRQAEVFKQAVKVTAIAVTKLDGTAKGGVVFSISKDLGIPVRFIGVGEGVEDLRPFNPKEFVEALFTE